MNNFSQVLHHPSFYYDSTNQTTNGKNQIYTPYNDNHYFDDNDVKRPMNSFLLWAKIMRKKYASENPTLHNAEVSKLLGKIWNSMSVLDKRPYVERAERLRVIHMRNYPNYRYAPKKLRERKQRRMITPENAASFHCNNTFEIKKIKNPKLDNEKNLISNDLKSFGYLRNACHNIFDTHTTDIRDNKMKYFNRVEKLCENKINPIKPFSNEYKCVRSSNFQSHVIKYKPEENIKESISGETMTLHYYPRINEEIKTDFIEEPTSFDLDEEFPEFLKSLIDQPLHLIGDFSDQTDSLWSDISEVIGSEF